MLNAVETIDIHVETRRDLDTRLEAAVATLQEKAMHTGTHGILVVRHQPGKYTVTLSDQVPYGLTRELLY